METVRRMISIYTREDYDVISPHDWSLGSLKSSKVYPNFVYHKAYDHRMIEITDQTIVENDKVKIDEEVVVGDDDDIYSPVAVSPCGKVFA